MARVAPKPEVAGYCAAQWPDFTPPLTKRPVEDGASYEVGSGFRVQPDNAGDSLAYTGHLTASGRSGDFDYLLSGSYEKTGSSFTADGERRPPDSFGTQGGLDDVDDFNILGKIGYEVEASRFDLSVNHYNYRQESDWAGVVGGGSISGGTSATPSAGNLNTRTPGIRNTTISGKYSNSDIFGGSMDLQLFYNHNTTTFTRTEAFTIVYPQYETESQKYGARLTFDTPFELAGQDLSLIWGLDYLHDKTQVNDIDAPSGTPDATLDGVAPFAQLNADIGDRFRVTGGLRYEVMDVEIPDFVNSNGFAVTGGTVSFNEPLFNVSGSYDISDTVEVFGGFSQGFQLGNLVRFVTDNNVASVASLAAKGQKTNSYEAGLRFTGDAWDITATGFYNRSDNGESYTASLDLVLAPEEVYGFELAGRYDFGNGLVVGGTATWMEGRYDTDGDGRFDTDLGSDRIQPAKITAYAELTPNDWSAYRVQALYSGRRDPDSAQFLGLQTIEPYFLVDAFADFKVGKGTLSVGMENVFNTDYAPVIQQAYSVELYGYDDYYYVKGPGRTISASYTVKF